MISRHQVFFNWKFFIPATFISILPEHETSVVTVENEKAFNNNKIYNVDSRETLTKYEIIWFFRDAGRYDTTIGHGQSPLCSTQERRKLLKRTRSLAVISEDESSRSPSRGHVIEPSADLRLGYDTSSLQHQRRHQLIPRAKLIDRNTLKDR